MTKEEILLSNFNYGFTGMENDAIFKSMQDYAKEVLKWVTQLKDGEGDYLIIATDGQFYWSGDEDGDSPVSPEQIIKLYENDQKKLQ